tara:strand:+ start:421 stop:585 length:165 start_codon:yes stop_codon:yes gene_type:complete
MKKIGVIFGCCNVYPHIYINKVCIITEGQSYKYFVELKVIADYGDKGKQLFRAP